MSEITETIVALLERNPGGLTTREVGEHTGMTSYNTSGKLSKLAAYGVINAEKIDRQSYRWMFKPPKVAAAAP